MTQTLADYIQQYQSEGLSFFPVPLCSKEPTISWKQYQSQKPNEYEIGLWRKQYPSNLGVVCGSISGNLVVLDCDTPEVFNELAKVMQTKLGITDIKDFTRITQTAHGFHIWLRTFEPVKSTKFPKLDIKGEGGYILVPPSLHPTGYEYHFINDTPIAQVFDLTQVGIDLTQGENKGSQPNWVSKLLIEGSSEGSRNNDAVKLAGYFRSRHPRDITESLMLNWNKLNKPPLPQYEVMQAITSCYNYPENYSTSTIEELSKRVSFLENKLNNHISYKRKGSRLE